MSASVRLSVISGPSAGTEFFADEKAHCVVGRAPDCALQIVENGAKPVVSRHHCLFDINPPDVRVRDFGSLNGTRVNDREIGRRRPGQTPEEGARLEFREYDLLDGDEVRLGKAVIRVGVDVTPADDLPEAARCGVCGRDMRDSGAGKRICRTCRRDPGKLLLGLLRPAGAPGGELPAITGYEPVRELGRGGQGIVWLVRHIDSGELRALKVQSAQAAVEPRAERSFLREMDNIRGLRHPNIVAFRDGGAVGAMFYFVCEYCAEGSVDELVRRRGTLEVDEAVRLTTQALEGLAYAHDVPVEWGTLDTGPAAIGLIHRDVKPANILLAAAGAHPIAKLADFGLAKAFERAGLSGHTMTGSMAGTVGFMARPQLINYKFAKPEVDVWAMAASLYFMLTGHPPRHFPAGTDPIAVVLRDKAVPIRQRDRNLPRRLAAVIDEALIDEPAIRITTATQLRDALLAAL
ncbi:protein kinase domain-containing protein [Nocardia wallacei]|uniref:protein kinase domain-containing protein n=1 Tax=Nocardia wallacei TaxID=480035 RepID=UPI00245627BF|nr:protein kinase [Nocardia wallacei]